MATKETESMQDEQHETEAAELTEETAEHETEETLADEERLPEVSARDLPPPATKLAIPPQIEIGKLTISLSGDSVALAQGTSPRFDSAGTNKSFSLRHGKPQGQGADTREPEST